MTKQDTMPDANQNVYAVMPAETRAEILNAIPGDSMNAPISKIIYGHTPPFGQPEVTDEIARKRHEEDCKWTEAMRMNAIHSMPESFRRPDVAAPRTTSVPGVLRPEIRNQPGMNDICEVEPRGTAAMLTAHIERLDRVSLDLHGLIGRAKATLDSNAAEREHAVRELAALGI